MSQNKISVTRILGSHFDVDLFHNQWYRSTNNPTNKRTARKLKRKANRMLDKFFPITVED